MTFGLAIVLALAVLHYVLVSRVRGLFTADGLFVVFQVLLVWGTYQLVSEQSPIEVRYFWVCAVPVMVYCVMSILLHLAGPVTRNESMEILMTPFRSRDYLLLILSAGIVVLYFSMVGYNTFIVAIQSTLSGEEEDIATLRLESYAGARYLAPGYVNQFKNSILPVMAVVGSILLFRRRHPSAFLWTILFGGIALIGVLGTGQRGAFVVVAMVFVVALRHALPRDRFLRFSIPLISGLLGIVLLSTLLLGRSKNHVDQTAGFGGTVWVLLQELWKRVANDNQGSGLQAFYYTESIAPSYGRYWYEEMLGLTPWHRGSNLAGQVFKTVYGSDRGTMPPSIWGSAYYTFGVLALILMPVILALINYYLAKKFLAQSRRDVLEVAGYSGVFVALGSWIAGSPLFLFNVGLVAYVFLIWLGKRRRQSALAEVAERLPGRT